MSTKSAAAHGRRASTSRRGRRAGPVRARRPRLAVGATSSRTWELRTSIILSLTVVALVVAACGSSAPSSARSSSAKVLTTMTVGYVPAFNVTALYVGQQEGFFKQEGLKLILEANDSGPALISSTINGTYQASFVAAFPALLAYSKGAPVKAIAGSGVVEPHEEAEAVFVRSGSGITSLKDLSGKTIGTNALTSAVTLGAQGGISAEGGNPSTTKFIALPFTQAIEEVQSGSLDAAALIDPYISQAKTDGLTDLGDPITKALPSGTPYGIYISSDTTVKTHAQEIKKFVAALAEADSYINSHPNKAEESEITNLGIPTTAAAASLPQPLATSMSEHLTIVLARLMVKYSYMSTIPDIAKFMP